MRQAPPSPDGRVSHDHRRPAARSVPHRRRGARRPAPPPAEPIPQPTSLPAGQDQAGAGPARAALLRGAAKGGPRKAAGEGAPHPAAGAAPRPRRGPGPGRPPTAAGAGADHDGRRAHRLHAGLHQADGRRAQRGRAPDHVGDRQEPADREKEFDRTVDYIRATIDALKDLDNSNSRFLDRRGHDRPDPPHAAWASCCAWGPTTIR